MYLRPAAFIDTPVGFDGQCARLAGGLTWFSAVELIVRGVPRRLFPVERLEEARAASSDGVRFDRLWRTLTSSRVPLAGLRFDEPSVMGIINVTPDSFSDGGVHADPGVAAAAAHAMLAAGAKIIDIGAESTRPGAKPLWHGDEIARLEPVLDRLKGAPVSIDTRKAEVAEAALRSGATLINDVSALTFDPNMAPLAVASSVPVVLMHHQGDPQSMQDDPRYKDVMLDVFDWLEARVAAAVAGGIARDKIVVDPGIGFGKTLRHNLALLNGLSIFHGLGCPILLGASRKRFIGALSGVEEAGARLAGSLAVMQAGLAQGVQLFRVHDVAESVQALRVWRGLRDEALTPA